MPKLDIAKLAAAIKDAAAHAKACADFEEWDDGGTCNFDAPYIRMRGIGNQKAEAIAEEIGQLSGVRCYILNSKMFGRTLQISGALEGQGNRRTRMAEDIKRELEKAGIEAHMWYQMD